MKQQNKQRYLIRYLTIFAILFSIVIVKTSCTKLDVNYQANQAHPPNFVEQFFSTKTTPTPAVANLIQKLKDENDKTGFVNKLPKNCGLPIWEKVVIKKQLNHNEDNSLYSPASHGPSANFTTGDSTEVDIIPLTITDSALSSVIIVKEENGTTTTDCKTTNGDLYNVVIGNNYAYATELLALFFYMENQTYGTKKFYHVPTTTFPQSSELGTDGLKIITMSDDTTNNNTSSFRLCKKYLVLCQECHQFPCVAGNSYEYEVCINIPIPPIPLPPGGGGGGGGTGGGPCGTCTPPPPPPNCNDPFYSFGPCGPNNPPPPPPPPPVPPCDTFINTLQNNAEFNNKVSYLEQDSVFDKHVETGFTGILGNNNPSQYKYAQGETVSGGIGTIDFYKLQYFPHGPVDVILHCHADNGAGVNLNSIFSPYDVIFMASNLLNGTNMYKNNANFAFVVTAKGFETNTGNPKTVTYMLKITDLQAFTNFAIANTGADGNDAKKMGKFVKKHNYKFITKNIPNSEREFLKMLKMNANGIGNGLSLYKADNTSGSRKWSRLNLNGNTVNQTNCY